MVPIDLATLAHHVRVILTDQHSIPLVSTSDTLLNAALADLARLGPRSATPTFPYWLDSVSISHAPELAHGR